MTLTEIQRAELATNGFLIVKGVVSSAEVRRLVESVECIRTGGTALDRGGSVYAIRDLLRQVPEVRRSAETGPLRELAQALLGPHVRAVRGILFDKNTDTNWMVPWHQDLTIAVRAQRDVHGFGPWTVKFDIPHATAPTEILERMVTIRLHLDPCKEANGPLRVIPGSHVAGKLDSAGREQWVRSAEPVTCLLDAGDVLIMRPLLLHSSLQSTGEGRRRVVHVELADMELPGGLEWFEAVP